ncbi:MAG: hypothetical protein Q4E65_10085 [Clostridia bacterium]|nr:hypothetical protein [Clostridia bacterium]
MKLKKCFALLFLIVGFLTVLEFVFVRGMFTWLIAVAASILAGGANILLCLRNRQWMDAALYLLATVALCMGYLVIAG